MLSRALSRPLYERLHRTLEEGAAGSGATDPLAGVVFALRLQTHAGDNVPVGLYQDVACTIPATADGHVVAAWRDELGGSGKTYSQSDVSKRPLLKIVSGAPVVRFDGIDDVLELVTGWDISSALLAVSCRVSGSFDYSIFTNGTVGDSFWRFSGDGNGYIGVFRTARINAYPMAMPITGSHIFTVASGADYEIRVDGASKGIQTGSFSAVSAASQIGARGASEIPFAGDYSAVWVCEDLSNVTLFESQIPATP